MNILEFYALQPGDLVRHVSGSTSCVVTANYGRRITAVRTFDLTNPLEWELVSKAEHSKPPNTRIRITDESSERCGQIARVVGFVQNCESGEQRLRFLVQFENEDIQFENEEPSILDKDYEIVEQSDG